MNKETLGVLITFLDALQNWHLTLIIKTPEWRYWHCSGVFIINLEKISVHCSVVSLVYFEQVNSGCVHGSTKKWTYIFLLYWNCIWTNNKQSAIAEGPLHKKCPNSEFFWSSFSAFGQNTEIHQVFSSNAEKYRPEKLWICSGGESQQQTT